MQGVGGAALVPASLALVAASFAKGEERNRAMGVYGATAGVGFVFGMVLGGVITEFLGWRWVLFVNVPVALAVLSLAPVAIHESKNEAAPRMLDLAGAAMVTLGLASVRDLYSSVAVGPNVVLPQGVYEHQNYVQTALPSPTIPPVSPPQRLII